MPKHSRLQQVFAMVNVLCVSTSRAHGWVVVLNVWDVRKKTTNEQIAPVN